MLSPPLTVAFFVEQQRDVFLWSRSINAAQGVAVGGVTPDSDARDLVSKLFGQNYDNANRLVEAKIIS